MLLSILTLMSCSREGMNPHQKLDYEYGRDIAHDRIVLGDRLENPYKTENIEKALQSLYPTKAGRVDVKTTNLYVRFLPKTEEEIELLRNNIPNLTDHPLDYAIKVDGDWYHDPEVPEGELTWQYAVVPKDYVFPDIEYELIDECHISENDMETRAGDIDWEAVEMEAYRITGNQDMIPPSTRANKGEKVKPSGRLTIVDEHYCGGKPIGIAGVRVSCNSFVKFSNTYTDRDGYYNMDKSFTSDVRYRIVFKNEMGFSIGLNLVLVPASVSTLGKSGPEGVNMTVTKDSDDKLFRRSAVNNAAYDYYVRCDKKDMNVMTPPSDLRIWLFNSLKVNSAVMLHHGAIMKNDMVTSFLGKAAPVLAFFLPDITIGTKGITDDYRLLYSATCHELAHASHFRKVGTSYWDKYIFYIAESFLKTMDMTYGDGEGDKAGYCEVSEMWAYYLESKMFKDRYGGSFPTFGTSYWFYPQILRSLDERGIGAGKIFSVLDSDVTSRDILENKLIRTFPDKSKVIGQIFSRHQNNEQ